MKESDQAWFRLFLLSCMFWLIASGALRFDPTDLMNAAPSTHETSRLARLMDVK